MLWPRTLQLAQGMLLSVWGAGGSTRCLETPVRTLDTASTHPAPSSTGPHGGVNTSTLGHYLRARGPHEQCLHDEAQRQDKERFAEVVTGSQVALENEVRGKK